MELGRGQQVAWTRRAALARRRVRVRGEPRGASTPQEAAQEGRCAEPVAYRAAHGRDIAGPSQQGHWVVTWCYRVQAQLGAHVAEDGEGNVEGAVELRS